MTKTTTGEAEVCRDIWSDLRCRGRRQDKYAERKKEALLVDHQGHYSIDRDGIRMKRRDPRPDLWRSAEI
ncbi:hypothetical protein TIFTF001_036444 [Ficus carica]|uniref:Uncharacterized protein n=1 Tax=Ficus carica TaxID=3494 RepID=A0AA88E4A5_FICCA|nr:hypothetical protein TIFTF001_036444 [Ficus carica]